MNTLNRLGILWLVFLLLAIPTLTACGGDDDDKTPSPNATSTQNGEPVEKVKITIGNHTDKTGAASQAMQIVDAGLADVIEYYNDNNLIPGVEVKLVEYDGMLDPGRDVPGWEWLKEKGADVIMAWLPAISLTLQPLAERDQIPLFVTLTVKEQLEIPGNMFAGTPLFEEQIWTLINWVMENDWDWQTKGPAKVGGGVDEGSNPDAIFGAFKEYAETYPERMEWVGGRTIPMGVYTWATEVETLKDCDYIYLPHIFPFFVKDYVNAGYTKARFLTTDSHTSFLSLLDDMGYWPEIDGMLNLTQSEWWTEDSEYSNFARELAQTYRSGMISDIERNPKGYNSLANGVHVLESIKIASETVGPENIDSQAIIEAAEKLVLEFDGVQRFSYTETKRTSPDRLAIYEANSQDKSFVRLSDWLPIEGPLE